MTANDNKSVILRLAQAINAGDFDALDSILALDYIRHDPNPLMADAGRDKYKAAFRALRAGFPDAQWTIEDLLTDGDKVVARWIFRGTHDGKFFNLMPTGKVVSYPILAIYRVEDGMIAEDWHIFHSLALWQTLIPEISRLVSEASA
jgi:steroid delta-isomerase-like uncharacterized protein